MIDKIKRDSLTHLDPAGAANLSMGGISAKVKLLASEESSEDTLKK